MKYKTVFDVGKKCTSLTYYLPIPFFFISFILCMISLFDGKNDLTNQISFSISSLGLLIWSLINITQVIADFLYLVEPYRKGQCEVIEGMISNLTLIQHTARAESFEVSGLKFVFPNTSTRIGYKTTVSNGGYVTDNGQNVRITYVYNEKLGNDNVILKLEVENPEISEKSVEIK